LVIKDGQDGPMYSSASSACPQLSPPPPARCLDQAGDLAPAEVFEYHPAGRTARIRVECPAGAVPGDEVSAWAEGVEHAVTVPPEAAAGAAFDVDVRGPSTPPSRPVPQRGSRYFAKARARPERRRVA
jgi:hypothetical protein